MKTMFKSLAVIILTLALLVPQNAVLAGGGAGGGGTYQIRERGVSVVFVKLDGCIQTVLQVFAAEQAFKSPSTPRDAGSFAFVSILQFDNCTGEFLMDAFGSNSISASELQISKKLDLATLNTTVTVVDQLTNTAFDVYVDVTWTGDGPLLKDMVRQHSNDPGCMINYHTKGTFRPADVSASVSDGTTDFAAGAEAGGEIFSVKVGSVTVGCNP